MFRLGLAAIGILAGMTAHSAFGQVGCGSGSPCTNPVPVTDISTQTFASIWLDTDSNQYSITTTSGSISGSVVVHNPAGGGCPDITYTLSGTLYPSIQTDGTQGTASISMDATGPVPSATCGGYTPDNVHFSGYVDNDGNDKTLGISWINVTSGLHGTMDFTKSPSDIPVSETTNAVGFGAGLYGTVGQFRQVLNHSAGWGQIFQGRQVTERTGFPNYDNCCFSGSIVPQWVGVVGSSWNVGYYAVNPPLITSLNEWSDDYIG